MKISKLHRGKPRSHWAESLKNISTQASEHFRSHLVSKIRIHLICLISCILLLGSALGCASFPKKTETPQYLNKNNINALNGKYSLKEISRSSLTDSTSFSYSKNDIGFNHTFFDEIDSRFYAIEIDSSKSYYFTLKIINTKKIKINLIKDDSIIKQKIIGFRLKDDGYIYLKNNNFKIRGIPYVFGDFNKKRIRLTLNKDNNLLFETSEFESGGVALLMVVPIGKMKYQKIYQRIE